MSGRLWKKDDALRECCRFLMEQGYTIPDGASADAVIHNTRLVARRISQRKRKPTQRQLKWTDL